MRRAIASSRYLYSSRRRSLILSVLLVGWLGGPRRCKGGEAPLVVGVPTCEADLAASPKHNLRPRLHSYRWYVRMCVCAVLRRRESYQVSDDGDGDLFSYHRHQDTQVSEREGCGGNGAGGCCTSHEQLVILAVASRSLGEMLRTALEANVGHA